MLDRSRTELVARLAAVTVAKLTGASSRACSICLTVPLEDLENTMRGACGELKKGTALHRATDAVLYVLDLLREDGKEEDVMLMAAEILKPKGDAS